ncbi:MBL fold metallo-hydrolase [Plantactinospora sp. WMMC1484]|uniref:MBL fold metallo-hydrolase n=1 Tax=Plantactinospora sp. WMMC1484 TaxID=3404122 RepID=UPI003BF4C390
MTTTVAFTEIADRVYVLRQRMLDVNVTLVVGDGAALLVDTLSTASQAAELLGALRELTADPLIVVNTHHHFDHCFGNAALAAEAPVPIYAHDETARLLREQPALLRRQAYDEVLPADPGLAAELARTAVLAPTHPVRKEATVDVGGRTVLLRHLGRGHTEGDLVVQVPDADVLVAGDLIEESGPPAFEDAFPLEWVETVAALLDCLTPASVVVPGHGAVVGTDFVRVQHDDLATMSWLIRNGDADRAPAERVAQRTPFGPEAGLAAVQRGYAELRGDA